MRVSFTRIEAKKELNYFVEKKLIHYSKLRNFITDNQNQLTTSCLSPYITHGILTENEVTIDMVVNQALAAVPPMMKKMCGMGFSHSVHNEILNIVEPIAKKQGFDIYEVHELVMASLCGR